MLFRIGISLEPSLYL